MMFSPIRKRKIVTNLPKALKGGKGIVNIKAHSTSPSVQVIPLCA